VNANEDGVSITIYIKKMTQLMFFLKDIKTKRHKMLTGKLIISESLVQKWVLSWQGRQK